MKSIMISIQPKWCEKIARGKKTIEVRKTSPTIKTPFKCYIYCTKGQELWGDGSGETWKGIAEDEDLQKVFELNPTLTQYNGKVIGEFVCDKIYKIKNCCGSFIVNNDIRLTERIARASCLYVDEMQKYLGDKDGYAWHISDLVIYDKPKELSEFKSAFHCFNFKNVDCKTNAFGEHVNQYYNNSFCRICKYYNSDFGDCDKPVFQPLVRPPISWCYVETGE